MGRLARCAALLAGVLFLLPEGCALDPKPELPVDESSSGGGGGAIGMAGSGAFTSAGGSAGRGGAGGGTMAGGGAGTAASGGAGQGAGGAPTSPPPEAGTDAAIVDAPDAALPDDGGLQDAADAADAATDAIGRD